MKRLILFLLMLCGAGGLCATHESNIDALLSEENYQERIRVWSFVHPQTRAQIDLTGTIHLGERQERTELLKDLLTRPGIQKVFIESHGMMEHSEQIAQLSPEEIQILKQAQEELRQAQLHVNQTDYEDKEGVLDKMREDILIDMNIRLLKLTADDLPEEDRNAADALLQDLWNNHPEEAQIAKNIVVEVEKEYQVKPAAFRMAQELWNFSQTAVAHSPDILELFTKGPGTEEILLKLVRERSLEIGFLETHESILEDIQASIEARYPGYTSTGWEVVETHWRETLIECALNEDAALNKRLREIMENPESLKPEDHAIAHCAIESLHSRRESRWLHTLNALLQEAQAGERFVVAVGAAHIEHLCDALRQQGYAQTSL